MSSHQPGNLKQKNKKHKGTRGKRALFKAQGAGKTNQSKGGAREDAKSKSALKQKSAKADRINRNNQLKKQKRDQVWLQKRAGTNAEGGSDGIDGGDGIQKTIGIIPLSDAADTNAVVKVCLEQMGARKDSRWSMQCGASSDINKGVSQPLHHHHHHHCSNIVHAYDHAAVTAAAAGKRGGKVGQHYYFITPPPALKRDLFCALEIAKVVDVILFAVQTDPTVIAAASAPVMVGDNESQLPPLIDAAGLSVLSALKAQGCPESIFCVDGALSASASATATASATTTTTGGRMAVDDHDHDHDEEDEDLHSMAAGSVLTISTSVGNGKSRRRRVKNVSLRKMARQFIATHGQLPDARVIDINIRAVPDLLDDADSDAANTNTNTNINTTTNTTAGITPNSSSSVGSSSSSAAAAAAASAAAATAGGGEDTHMLIRTLREVTPRAVVWRAQRSYFAADTSTCVVMGPMEQRNEVANAGGTTTNGDDGDGGQSYRVRLSGYLKGRPLSINSLLHIGGVGTGRIVKAWKSTNPLLLSSGAPSSASRSSASSSLAQDIMVAQVLLGTSTIDDGQSSTLINNALEADPGKQDSLVLESSHDALLGEQTWPSDAEMDHDDENNKAAEHSSGDREKAGVGSSNKLSGVVLGKLKDQMSSYQADWFRDEEGNLVDIPMRDEEREQEEEERKGGEKEEDEDGSSIGDDDIDDGLTLGAATFATAKSQRAKAEEGDAAFPDEVDTPHDVSARSRFARYRALQSFRGSPWHPQENLPSDYARIFQFENFAGVQKSALAESKTVEHMQMMALLRNKQQQQQQQKKSKILSRSKRSTSVSNADAMSMAVEEEEEEGEGHTEGEDAGSGIEMRIESDAKAVAVAAGHSSHPLLVAGTEEYIRAGQYVSFEVADVPASIVERIQAYGFLTCWGLYPHENKLSVLHSFVVKHTAAGGASSTSTISASATVATATAGKDDGSIKSKDELLFMMGFRSFVAKPIFSESNLNCDKHRFERFLQADRFCMASCYGPVCMSTGSTPLLVFKRTSHCDNNINSSSNIHSHNHSHSNDMMGNHHNSNPLAPAAAAAAFAPESDDMKAPPLPLLAGAAKHSAAGWQLVATGSLHSVEPDRIMLKKVVLTGFPIRVRKKFAVVKHLFYDPQDVRWFKPAELATKWGLRGHIKEPVGTHGLLKAQFSGPIKQNDTVMLVLYKRVYPKLPYHGLQVQ